jgi:bifunctional UDP-N-acetylglucosamine pyrophosphorylase/glucosamine-1-phosphate N-acetyltransferase
MSETPLSSVVLAAGSGSRMRSARPKPLHPLCGKPMLVYVLEALAPLGLDRQMLVVGAGAEQVSKKLVEVAPDLPVELVHQPQPLGTGAATAAALVAFDDLLDIDDHADVVVVPADMPLVTTETLRHLVTEHRATGAAASVLARRGSADSGYGILVDGRAGEVGSIDRDPLGGGSSGLVAAGVFCFRRSLLTPALRRVHPEDLTDEIRLGEVVEVLHDMGYRTISVVVDDPVEVQGVNDRVDLARTEAQLRARINFDWMARGVTMVDPARTVIDTTVVLAADVTLFPGTLLQGLTAVGEGAQIGPDTHLVDCAIGQGARVRHSVGRDAEVGSFAEVGPFAVLEPGASVAPASTIGPFEVVSGAGFPDALT